MLYDDNQITIDGHTEISFTEDVPARFKSYGWHTITVQDGNNDLEALAAAIEEAKSVGDKPTLISVKYVEFGEWNARIHAYVAREKIRFVVEYPYHTSILSKIVHVFDLLFL